MHLVLAEEMKTANEHCSNGGESYNWQEECEKAFLRCFRKVDADVSILRIGNEGGAADADVMPDKANVFDAIGSTAVVSVICPTYIIVANCGDSRAVLCRGKESVPLSIDHKVGDNIFVIFDLFPFSADLIKSLFHFHLLFIHRFLIPSNKSRISSNHIIVINVIVHLNSLLEVNSEL